MAAVVEDVAAGVLTIRAVSIDERADGVHFVAELVVGEGSDVETRVAADQLRSHGGALANAGALDGVVLVEAVDLSGETRETVRRGLMTAAAELARQRTQREAELARFRTFARSLEACWPPDRPPA